MRIQLGRRREKPAVNSRRTVSRLALFPRVIHHEAGTRTLVWLEWVLVDQYYYCSIFDGCGWHDDGDARLPERKESSL